MTSRKQVEAVARRYHERVDAGAVGFADFFVLDGRGAFATRRSSFDRPAV